MKEKYVRILFILMISLGSVMAQTTTEEMKEFAEANYLQIDHLEVPKGIQRVEEQLRENVIDVIIHSKTHMPIFAQKRVDGYSKNYKKFYGLNIKILPILGDDDFYSLQLFYFNWTTNKFDKKLVKKISKYNVLNELRFATYEILLGKQWVLDHKDQIESRNFERIQAVREVIAEQVRQKKKKKKDEELERIKKNEEEEVRNARNLIKREEREKKSKKQEDSAQDSFEGASSGSKKHDSNSKEIETDVEKTKTDESLQKKLSSGESKKSDSRSTSKLEEESSQGLIDAISPELPSPGIPKKSYLYGFSNYFQETTETSGGLINTTTSLKYIGVGGRFILERETFIPTGVRVSFQAGMPIFREKYTFPVYRGIESEVFASKIFNHFQLHAGLDFVPVYFVGLPAIGSRFQVYENDFLWMKIGASFNKFILERNFDLRISYLKSLLSKSNQTDKFEATKIMIVSYFQITGKHGAEFNFSTTTAAGAFDISSKRIAFSYVYKFEN